MYEVGTYPCKNYKAKMLYNIDFYDGVISAIAEMNINGVVRKVYLHEKHFGPYCFDDEDDLIDCLSKYQDKGIIKDYESLLETSKENPEDWTIFEYKTYYGNNSEGTLESSFNDKMFIFDLGREYKVYLIPDDLITAFDNNHKLFQTLVGYHTDYNENYNVYVPHDTSDFYKLKIELPKYDDLQQYKSDILPLFRADILMNQN